MQKISKNISENIRLIQQTYLSSIDIIIKQMNILDSLANIVYVNGLINMDQLSNYIIKPIYEHNFTKNTQINFDYIIKNAITFPDVKILDDCSQIFESLEKGKAVMFIDGIKNALEIGVDLIKERSIQEPPTSAVLKGPRKGFVENIKTNIGMIKLIIPSPKLTTKYLYIGRLTKTQIAVMYIDKIADKKVVKKIIQRLNKIDIDGILDSYYISQFLEQRPHSLFKQIGSSEKPDTICSKLLEGRVAILVNGSPIVLTLPFLFVEELHSADDYYNQSIRATFLRFLRLFSLLITVMLPSLYLAIVLYHYKAIPLSFLVTIINSTQGIPLSPFVEVFFVLVLFEILYESSLRMPKYLGISLSVVGALILGDTAVSAGIISPPAVMIIALGGITLYTVPDQASQLSILRFAYTMVGGFLGCYGITLFTIYLIYYLNDLDSYGAPYLSPFSPYVKNDLKDAIYKNDIVDMNTRPQSFKVKNKRRLKSDENNN